MPKPPARGHVSHGARDENIVAGDEKLKKDHRDDQDPQRLPLVDIEVPKSVWHGADHQHCQGVHHEQQHNLFVGRPNVEVVVDRRAANADEAAGTGNPTK
jgi:hypothetical protein